MSPDRDGKIPSQLIQGPKGEALRSLLLKIESTAGVKANLRTKETRENNINSGGLCSHKSKAMAMAVPWLSLMAITVVILGIVDLTIITHYLGSLDKLVVTTLLLWALGNRRKSLKPSFLWSRTYLAFRISRHSSR